MDLVEKLRLYCSINELGRISDTDFKGLVREAIGLKNKKRISITARTRTEDFSRTEAYSRWLEKYFKEKETDLPEVYIALNETTEVPEKKLKNVKVHADKPIVS